MQVGLLCAAGLFGGAVNALAGGGSLLTFPALMAAGLPPLSANVSNSIAVCPGYVAAVFGSRSDLARQRRFAVGLIPTGVVGTIVGAALLLASPASAFETVVPVLVIAAALTLAFQGPIRSLIGHPASMSRRRSMVTTHTIVGIGGVYGGYFGAALGVMLVAGLALVRHTTLARVTAVKNLISASCGLTSVVVYSLFGPVNWLAVAIVAVGTVVGGFVGAKAAAVMPQRILRGFIVAFGVTVGIHLAFTTYW